MSIQRLGLELNRLQNIWKVQALKTFELAQLDLTAVTKLSGHGDELDEVVGSLLLGHDPEIILNWVKSSSECKIVDGTTRKGVMEDIHASINSIQQVLNLYTKGKL